MHTIEWSEVAPAASEVWLQLRARLGDTLPARGIVIHGDFTFAWDDRRAEYRPTENCRRGARPEAL